MPRKPGGKYKGKCGRSKDPAELALEQLEKAAAARQKAIAKAQEQKKREMGSKTGMGNSKEEEEEAKKTEDIELIGGRQEEYQEILRMLANRRENGAERAKVDGTRARLAPLLQL